jgi:hypothetical protein
VSGITPTGWYSQVDINHVLASKQGNSGHKGRSFKEDKTSTTTDTWTTVDATYFLIKDDTITFQGHQYFTYSTMIQYCIGQHKCASNIIALIDSRSNGCFCGDDTLVLEGSEQFVDVSGLGGIPENKLLIVTEQAFIETH